MDVARTLGKTPWGAFLSVALPQARPAIVVGVSLALMECLNDIAAVGFFGVNTLTLGIYTTWLGEGNLGGAAQLAVALLIFVFALLWVERHARKRQSTMPGSRHPMAPRRTALAGWRGILAMLACIVPVFLGFILPALILLKFAARHFEDILSPSYFNAMWHSFTLSLTASLVVVVLGLILAYAHRSQSGRKISNLLRLASVGYAMPGTVLGIGVLIPLAYFDNSVDAFMRSSFGCVHRTAAVGHDHRDHLCLCHPLSGHLLWLAGKRTGEGNAQPHLCGAHTWPHAAAYRTGDPSPHSAPCACDRHPSGLCGLHEGTASDAHPAAL